MVDTSRSGQRGGRQGQEYQPESTGASDTNPTTNTNVSGENPRPIMTFAALSDRINEELAHTSPGSVPQSTSDVNATAERGANTNFLSPADLATRLNQHIERFGVFNSPFGAPRTLSDGLVRRLALQVDQLINSNDAIKKKLEGFGERLQRLEARSTAVEERLQAFDEQLQRFAGSSHEVERRLNNLDYIDQLTNNHLEQVEGALPPLDERVRRLETRSMANQNDAVTRLANRLSRTNQRLDQLEERIPEDDEHWARVLEVTREAANPTSAPPYEIDQLELPPYGPHYQRGYEWGGYEWGGYEWGGYEWGGYEWGGYEWAAHERRGYEWAAHERAAHERGGYEWECQSSDDSDDKET
ncbi:hypothetical protein GGI35DRAFT_475534 [Trichoderma velutinum]